MTDGSKLSAKHLAFCEAYLSNGFKRDEAARTAKYSEARLRQTASDIMKRPDVKAYLDKRMDELQMSANETLLRIIGHATGNITEFIGLTIDELKAHPRAALIKKIKFTTVFPEATMPPSVEGSEGESSEGKEAPPPEPPKPYQIVESIELYSAQTALELLGKHHKLFTDRHEISGEDGKPIPVLVTGMDMSEL